MLSKAWLSFKSEVHDNQSLSRFLRSTLVHMMSLAVDLLGSGYPIFTMRRSALYIQNILERVRPCLWLEERELARARAWSDKALLTEFCYSIVTSSSDRCEMQYVNRF